MVGFIWSDPNPNKPILSKVQEAIAYAQEKYGGKPVEIRLNKEFDETSIDDIPVIPWDYILPGNVYAVMPDGWRRT